MKYLVIIVMFLIFQAAFTQNTTISVISAEQANIVYRGINNRIKIAVPGARSFSATSKGNLTQKDSAGNYFLNVNNIRGNTAKISVEATLVDGRVINEEKEFEVRQIPRVNGYVASGFQTRTYEMTHEQLAKLDISLTTSHWAVTLDSAYTKPVSFALKAEGLETMLIKGHTLPEDAFSLLHKLPVGSELWIIDIYLYNPEGMCMRGIPPFKIKLIEKADEHVIKPYIRSEYYNTIAYRGIDNKFTISVPGAKSVNLRGYDLVMEEDNTYLLSVDVSKIKEDRMFLDFEVTALNDSVINTKEVIYIKDKDETLKKITINNKGCSNCILKMTLEELRDASIDIRVDDDKSSWANIDVFAYVIKLPDGGLIETGGHKITNEVLQRLSGLKNKAIIEISTNYYISFGFTYDPPPLKVMIL